MRITPTLPLIITAYFVIYVLWATNYITIKYALETIPPFLMGAIRFTIAGFLVYGISIALKNPILGVSQSLPFIKQGLLLNVAGTGALIWAEQYIPTGLAAVVYASVPVWIIILDSREWHLNFGNLSVVLGVILGIIGVVSIFGLQSISTDYNFFIGLLVSVAGAICWSVGTLFVKYEKAEVSLLNKLAIQMLSSGIMLGIIGIFRSELTEFSIASVTATSWFALGFQILIGSVLGYMAFLWLLKVRPALEVSTLNYVQPCVAIILGVLLANEALNLRIITALSLTLLAVFLIRYPNMTFAKSSKTLNN